jgi:hypothetical protein
MTVPEPPASAGLFDPGPIVGVYALVLSGYLVKLGLGGRARRGAADVEELAHS